MDKLDNIIKTRRTRLIVTFIAIVFCVYLAEFPKEIIRQASNKEVFEIAAAWTAWGLCVTGLVTAAGYYVNKETTRPSFFGMGMTVLGTGKQPEKRILKDHEDQSDPENIPL